jgi:hypothetical protein
VTRFVEVVNEATGIVQQVPEDYLDNPVLGVGLSKTVAQQVYDGDLEAEVVEQPPTTSNSVKEIEAFARRVEIDLGDAKTKAEKVDVITAALAAAGPAPDAGFTAPPPEFPNPDVQLVHGDVDDQPIIPALRGDTIPDDATSPTDTPPAGDEEN